MLKEIMELYNVSEDKAREMVKEEKTQFGNIISDLKASVYIINRKKMFKK